MMATRLSYPDNNKYILFRNYRGSHAGAVNCVRFNEDSSVAISGSIDSSVKCWDLRSKRYYKAII